MPNFFTQYNPPEPEPSKAGDAYLNVYQEEVQKNGTKELICTGKTNVYDRAQVDLESTKIENILKATALGDFSALRSQDPVYIDATTFPKNLMEASNIICKAKQEFENFPQEVRERFDNDADKYVNTMGTKTWLDTMSEYNDKAKAIKEAGNLKAYNARVAEQAKFEQDVAAAKGAATE